MVYRESLSLMIYMFWIIYIYYNYLSIKINAYRFHTWRPGSGFEVSIFFRWHPCIHRDPHNSTKVRLRCVPHHLRGREGQKGQHPPLWFWSGVLLTPCMQLIPQSFLWIRPWRFLSPSFLGEVASSRWKQWEPDKVAVFGGIHPSFCGRSWRACWERVRLYLLPFAAR